MQCVWYFECKNKQPLYSKNRCNFKSYVDCFKTCLGFYEYTVDVNWIQWEKAQEKLLNEEADRILLHPSCVVHVIPLIKLSVDGVPETLH